MNFKAGITNDQQTKRLIQYFRFIVFYQYIYRNTDIKKITPSVLYNNKVYYCFFKTKS